MNKALTRSYVGSYLLNAPLFALYALLPFIMAKDLKATAFQIALLISLKPTVALASSYWSAFVANRQDRLKKNIGWACVLAAIPPFFFPLISNTWFLTLAFALFFFAERAILPAWIELLNLSLSKKNASKALAAGSLVTFVAASVIPVFIGRILDTHFTLWKWLFPLMGAFSLLRALVCLRFALPPSSKTPIKQKLKGHLAHPWKTSWTLLTTRKDFALYQVIFLFGGLGLMVMQPALPRFVGEVLGLSYTELGIAFALCKGVGFALTNPLWQQKIHQTSIFRFCAFVTLAAALSVLTIAAASLYTPLIYLGFIFYGIMQAGSQLSWQMGGPLFAGAQDSSPYTGVNIILVGLRGLVGPLIGGLIFAKVGLIAPFFLGALLCLAGTVAGLSFYRQKAPA